MSVGSFDGRSGALATLVCPFDRKYSRKAVRISEAVFGAGIVRPDLAHAVEQGRGAEAPAHGRRKGALRTRCGSSGGSSRAGAELMIDGLVGRSGLGRSVAGG